MADWSRLTGEIIRKGDGSGPALGLVGRDNGKGELAKLVAKGELFGIERVDCVGHHSFEDLARVLGSLVRGFVIVISLAQFTRESVRIELCPVRLGVGGLGSRSGRLGLGDSGENAGIGGNGHWFGFHVVARRVAMPTIEA